MNIKDFIKERKYLVWYIKDPENLSNESIVEHTLNYGDFDDINMLIKILGIKETSNIFYNTYNKKRSNYSPQIKNYFKLYFDKYA